MAYASTQDIRDRAPQIQITDSSKPNQETVDAWLDDVHQTLDAALRNAGYITPVTGPASVLILRDMVVHKMISLILRARLYGIGDVNASGANEAQKFYDSRLAWLIDPTDPFVLPDADLDPEVPGSPGGRGAWSFGFVPDEDYADEAPRVTMGGRSTRWPSTPA